MMKMKKSSLVFVVTFIVVVSGSVSVAIALLIFTLTVRKNKRHARSITKYCSLLRSQQHIVTRYLNE